MIYADIIVDISHEKLDRSFQYRVPKELEADIQTGNGSDPFPLETVIMKERDM